MTTSDVTTCQRCPLREGCNQVVAGKGTTNSRLVLVGLNPGPEEDIEGEPFVGTWNRLFEIVLSQANIPANIVYKTYLVKCTPKKKQQVKSEYINTCKFWLWKELSLIKPKVVVPLGRTPTKVLLHQKSSFDFPLSVGRHHTVGYMDWVVAPWWSLDSILKEGAALRQETISFFSGLREFFT